MWVRRWTVRSRSSDATYTVAIDGKGNWGCDCPVGKFQRAKGVCKHVKEIQARHGATAPAHLPDAMPSQAITAPPVVQVAPARRRAGNVKEVWAKEKPSAAAPAPAVEPSEAGELLSKLEWD